MANLSVVDGIRSGDTSAIEWMYGRFMTLVEKFVVANSGSKADAHDLFQECMFFLYRRLQSDRALEIRNLETYFKGMYRNRWFQQLKLNRKEQTVRKEVGMHRAIEDEEIYYFIYVKALSKMGSDCQKVLQYYVQGKSVLEISQHMETTTDYAKRKKYLCKEKLKKIARELLAKAL